MAFHCIPDLSPCYRGPERKYGIKGKEIEVVVMGLSLAGGRGRRTPSCHKLFVPCLLPSISTGFFGTPFLIIFASFGIL